MARPAARSAPTLATCALYGARQYRHLLESRGLSAVRQKKKIALPIEKLLRGTSLNPFCCRRARPLVHTPPGRGLRNRRHFSIKLPPGKGFCCAARRIASICAAVSCGCGPGIRPRPRDERTGHVVPVSDTHRSAPQQPFCGPMFVPGAAMSVSVAHLEWPLTTEMLTFCRASSRFATA